MLADVLSGERRFHVECGDCLDVLRAMPADCVDAIVTDPPGGIEFMGMEWDSDGGKPLRWMRWLSKRLREARRVLKPGGFAFVWAIPRTSDLTGMACRLAGFELCDKVTHIFGQGMPHGLNVGLAIDDVLAVEHISKGVRPIAYPDSPSGYTSVSGNSTARKGGIWNPVSGKTEHGREVRGPGSLERQRWEGWNTALKPGVEDWWLVQKPIVTRRIADQVLATGTGALNVGACRVPTVDEAYGARLENLTSSPSARTTYNAAKNGSLSATRSAPNESGRYPANLVLSHGPDCEFVGTRKVKAAPPWNDNRGPSSFTGPETSPVHHSDADGTETIEDWKCADGCPVRLLDEQSGERPSGGQSRGRRSGTGNVYGKYGTESQISHHDSGGASRYFNTFPADPFIYAAKANRGEREIGLEHLQKGDNGRANEHPTVKSRFLMQHFVRLSCQPGGVVLDLFTGSGSTGVACSAEGMRFIGIELKPKYAAIARARIIGDAPLFNVVGG